MRNIIIGTAGHIDHGKTTLIKALTGRDTDRLAEEKKRGISIELGFTYFDLPSGRRAGIIDVPGHEKFIKNMLAGVGGIDIVILAIAADEGVMPQTQEHLNILNLLQVKTGIIALTKSDIVDEEWIEMVTEEVREATADTFLKDAPIIPVSSTKKTGIDKLIEQIDNLTAKVKNRDNTKSFRLPIDRVFTITGIGTIVTGTLVEGTININDNAMLYPGAKMVKIRSLQVHDSKVDRASAGQRVAVNLSNIKKHQISRGDVLAQIDSLQDTIMLDGKITLLKDSPFPIKHNDRVHLYIGTSEILARVSLLDKEELLAGEEGYAQFILEKSTTAKPMDHVIIRFYSPMITIGGALILDINPPKKKRYKEDIIKELKLKEKGDPRDILLQFLNFQALDLMPLENIYKNIGISPKEMEKAYKSLLEEKSIIMFKINEEIFLIHKGVVGELIKRISNYLEDYHKKHPLKPGAPKEEVRSKFLGKTRVKIVEELFKYMKDRDYLKIERETIALRDFEVRLTEQQKSIADRIEEEFIKENCNPPRPETILNNKEEEQVFQALVDWGSLIKIGEEIYFHKATYENSIIILKEYLKAHKEINAAKYRDLLKTSRKFAIALLEKFDQEKITKRKGDKRTLY